MAVDGSGAVKGSGNNYVQLRGKVIRAPRCRVLPSGDELVEIRISVRRTGQDRRSGPVVDWFDCAAWTATMRRAIGRWRVGDEIELAGSLRSRHFVVGDSGRTAVSVEVRSARRIARADRKQSARAQGIKNSPGKNP